MNYNTPCDSSSWSETGYVFDVNSLAAYFERVPDQRCARGKRYRLAQICILATLAKLSGEDHPWGMAQWAQLRHALLGPILNLPKRLPSHNTYRRALATAISAPELEQHISAFLRQQVRAGRSVLIALDGKTLRGTIPTGQSQGVHLLAAYLPAEGIVLLQMAVETKENEIVAAPKVLASLDLRGKIVMGDALHTQRELSAQIVAAAADYVWLAKDNQPQLRADIEAWFAAETHVKGFSPSAKDFQTARTVNKTHGRREERTLTTSSLLNEYLNWPGVAQVFKLERRTINIMTGELRREVVYGITSLSVQQADATRLLDLIRQYWGIENGLHYRRDKSLQEDATRMRNRNQAQNCATLNNLIVGLVLRQGWRYLPEARRHYAGCLPAALNLVFHGQS
jgi:predicted transposase YbfD/YdcC